MVFSYGAVLNRAIEISYNNNKVLRNIVNAPWYVRNGDIQRDLRINTVDSVVKKFARSHEDRLHQHVNPEAL